MSNYFLKFSFLILAFVYTSLNYANQNNFKVSVKWPKNVVSLKIFVNNGIETKTIQPNIEDYQITISDKYVGKYAVISVSIDYTDKNLPTYGQFYISKKPATIVYNTDLNLTKNSNIKTINAINVTHFIKEYDSISEPFEIEKRDYLTKKDIDSVYFSIFKKEIIKKLEFIKKNKNSYFAFKKFQSELVPLQFPFQDSLIDSFLSFYHETFSLELQKSLEGKIVEKKLQDKWVNTHEGIKAPEFKTIDYLGNKINSEDLKGKYVLINFWATWCAPCMAELPAIKKIKNKYSNKNLTIISVSFDKDFDFFVNAIKKNNLDWVNVHNDEKLAINFGGKTSLPQLFLIDKQGTIIYNRSSGKEIDNINLTSLNEILKRELKK